MDPQDLSAISDDDLDMSDEDQLREFMRRYMRKPLEKLRNVPIAQPDFSSPPPAAGGGGGGGGGSDPRVDAIVASITGGLGPLQDLNLGQYAPGPAAAAPPTEEELQQMMLNQDVLPTTGTRRMVRR